MAYEYILVERVDDSACITLNRPKANALSLELVLEIRAAVEEADADPAVKVILITGGEGKFFAAGADIPTIASTLDAPMAEGKLLAEGLKTMDRVAACTTPTVAVVNGIALGGGCELCLACDLRIASDKAIFGQPEINLGIIPGWGGTHCLPQIIGEGRARDWLMTGRQVSAAEALEAGLVCKLAPPEELRQAALELAAVLAGKARVAMTQTLDVLRQRAQHPDQAHALEYAAFEKAAGSEDAKEGVTAFLERREAKFTGR